MHACCRSKWPRLNLPSSVFLVTCSLTKEHRADEMGVLPVNLEASAACTLAPLHVGGGAACWLQEL
jgi:hypothetical protein